MSEASPPGAPTGGVAGPAITGAPTTAVPTTEALTADGVTAAELADIAERPTFRLATLDRELLASPLVLRAVAGLVLGLAALAWPGRTDRIVARLVGVALVWLALTAIRAAVVARPRRWMTIPLAAAAIAVGAFLVLSPDQSAVLLGRLIGAALLVGALRRAATGLRTDGDRTWPLVAGALAASGVLLLAFPDQLLALATTAAAGAWIAGSLLALAIAVDDRHAELRAGVGDRGAVELVAHWLADRPKSAGAREALYRKILFDGDGTRVRIFRFFTLMAFASFIASMGVVTDSTAVVIGAMLIAPLMTPLMGMAISLVMGWPNRLVRSAGVALGGIAVAIGTGLLVGRLAPTIIDVETNTQILGRSSPTLLDLATAVAAGAAGAYGLSRPDVSDSLPGVAIAISLVPPLTVTGIAYSQAEWGAGSGALLLFTTNMLAILIMGGVMFVLTGVTPLARVAESQQRVRTWLAGVAVAAAVVLGGLLLNGVESATEFLEQSEVETAVERWMEAAPEHRIGPVQLDRDLVTVLVIGPSEGLGDVDDLAAELTDALGRPIDVDVRLLVEERLSSGADDGDAGGDGGAGGDGAGGGDGG